MRRTPRTIGLGMLAGLAMAACTYQRTTVYEYQAMTSHDGQLYVIRSETTYAGASPVSSRASMLQCELTSVQEMECTEVAELEASVTERFTYDGRPEGTPNRPPPVPFE